MYAVIRSGSKQYKVNKGDIVELELLPNLANKTEITFEEVLLVADGDKIIVGKPLVKNAKVLGQVEGVIKDKKIIVFKYRRRKSSKRKIGHRQRYVRVRIKEIQFKEE